jgi:hypothetical protein
VLEATLESPPDWLGARARFAASLCAHRLSSFHGDTQLVRKIVTATAAAVLAIAATAAYADDLARHPNIAAADSYAQNAIARMHEAQRANNYDMHGHAARAISLLEEARGEMRAAAADASH